MGVAQVAMDLLASCQGRTAGWYNAEMTRQEMAREAGLKEFVTQVHRPEVSDPVDSDMDGMPDAWETLYFGGPGNADPSDLAANGVNTLLEAYIAGLNPTNSSNVFEINNFDADYDGLDSRHVMWSTASNRVYSIYWSPDLMHTPFTLMQSNILGGAFTDMVHGAESDGYYKVKVQLP